MLSGQSRPNKQGMSEVGSRDSSVSAGQIAMGFANKCQATFGNNTTNRQGLVLDKVYKIQAI